MRQILYFLFCLLPVLGGDLSAQSAAAEVRPVRLLLGGALELGGDRVGVITSEGDGQQLIRGAQGVSLVAGLRVQSPRLPRVFLDATVGYKYWRTLTDGAHVRLTRVPLHLTAHYRITDEVSVGLGLLSDRRIRFRGDGLGPDADYDPSLGTKFELEWRNLALGYTRMYYNRPDDRARCAGGFGLTYLVAL